MSNLAAILPSPLSPLQIQPVPRPSPLPHELLIKNQCIALNPIEGKIVLQNVLPYTPYLAILGATYGGVIEGVGEEREKEGWKVGERVVVSRRFDRGRGDREGGWQRWVVSGERAILRVPPGIDTSLPASLIMNLTCVVGLFTGRLHLSRPSLTSPHPPEPQSKKILLYGGSSSFGSLSIQYLSQSGYTVITTSSPSSLAFVSSLGAHSIHDHTSPASTLLPQLIAEGPYDLVVDFISTAPTLSVTGGVLAAQGGGRLYTTQPGREALPGGVERVFEPYSESLYEEGGEELMRWVVERYVPEGLERGLIRGMPVVRWGGGLGGIQEALRRGMEGGGRYVVDPWEEGEEMVG